MELKVRMNLSPTQSIEAVFEGNNIQDAIKAAGCLLEFDGECGNCKSKNIGVHTRTASGKDGKTFKYTEYFCKDCQFTKPWGALQDGSGFFLKSWKEPYKNEQAPE